MKDEKKAPANDRRDFLRRAGQTGLAGAAAIVAGTGSTSDAPPTPKASAAPEDKRGYHETEHIREYYRSSGIF